MNIVNLTSGSVFALIRFYLAYGICAILFYYLFIFKLEGRGRDSQLTLFIFTILFLKH